LYSWIFGGTVALGGGLALISNKPRCLIRLEPATQKMIQP